MKLLLLLLVLVGLSPATVLTDNLFYNYTCEPGEECSKYYELLAYQVTRCGNNLYNIQSIFFPPNKPPPVFVIVFYHFNESSHNKTLYEDNVTEIYDFNELDDNKTDVWFWTTSTFYIFQPLHVFQFTSLFFSNVAVDHYSTLHLYLPSGCQNASSDFKQLLAQRVSACLC